MGRLIRKVGAALGATACAAGLAALGPATSATATPTFVTPTYGMTCYTGTSGSFGSYQGYASCLTPAYAKWKVVVSCSWGLTPESVWIYTSSADGWQTLAPASTCYWGVNWVQVVEG
jgi:hypothetical protein